MRRKNIVIVAALTLIALAAVPLIAGVARQHGIGNHGGGMHGFAMEGLDSPRHLKFLRNHLDLSDAQEAQLKTIFADVRQQNAAYRQQMHSALKQSAALLLDDPNAVARAEEILASNDAAHVAMRQNLLQASARALRVLTPEQRAKAGELLARHVEGH